MKDLLLITPPFTQLNTPYPATAYLKGFLNTKNISSFQMDLGIEVIVELFSKMGLEKLFQVSSSKFEINENCQRIYALRNQYLQTIEPVISFLQGKNATLARQICSGHFLPEASRFQQLDDMDWAFGTMGMQDKAKHLATLYLEDLSDFTVACADEDFGFSRYAERLGRSANSFEELYQKLLGQNTFIDNFTLPILENTLRKVQPKLVCFSVPFPGNLYSAFKCAQYIKFYYPEIITAMGGGFPNTELRELKDVRVFEFFDFITLDDGELPIELLVDNIHNQSGEFKRTFLLEHGQVAYKNNSLRSDYKFSEVGTPDYSDLLLDNYISVIEIANPMHSLWSDGRWNKLTMAHGCYWGKCTFCDISLDYIKLYEPVAASLIVDRMETLLKETRESGFHFVDEAAPPALMREVALEILRRRLVVSWWTNIRFEKSFTMDLCHLLKTSGCIAVSGGLEVASDRLLQLIQKGVTVEQVARVTRNFTESGVMVHAYLMYGYPTQTVQETVDSLEMVRQMFAVGIMQSGFWHQFAMTAHSPVGIDPDAYGVIPEVTDITFAHNDIQFKDITGVDHNQFSFGLKKSLFNFMHGICLEDPLQNWFEVRIPKTTVAPSYIENCLIDSEQFQVKSNAKIYWYGEIPVVVYFEKSKKGNSFPMMRWTVQTTTSKELLIFEREKGDWLYEKLKYMILENTQPITLGQLQKDFELYWEDFELFWFSKQVQQLRSFGMWVI